MAGQPAAAADKVLSRSILQPAPGRQEGPEPVVWKDRVDVLLECTIIRTVGRDSV